MAYLYCAIPHQSMDRSRGGGSRQSDLRWPQALGVSNMTLLPAAHARARLLHCGRRSAGTRTDREHPMPAHPSPPPPPHPITPPKPGLQNPRIREHGQETQSGFREQTAPPNPHQQKIIRDTNLRDPRGRECLPRCGRRGPRHRPPLTSGGLRRRAGGRGSRRRRRRARIDVREAAVVAALRNEEGGGGGQGKEGGGERGRGREEAKYIISGEREKEK